MPRKIIDYKEVFPLDGAGIDACSEALDEQLRKIGTERENLIRIRFSLEESLLRLRDRFGEQGSFMLRIEDRFTRILLQLEHEGEIFNPLSKTEADLEDWSGSLLTTVGLSPYYSYTHGRNVIRLNLPVKGMNPALKTLIAVIIGIAAGFLFNAVFPADWQVCLNTKVLEPLYSFWIRLLTLYSGPVVFLMICTAVLSSSAIEEEGGSMRRIFARYFLLSMLAGLIAVAASSGALTGNTIGSGGVRLFEGNSIFESLLKIIPDDIISPLMTSNTPQIVFIAIVLGNGILLAGSRAESIRGLIFQGEMVGMQVTEWVGRLAPYFGGVLIAMEIINDTTQTFRGMWAVLIISVLLSAAMLLVVLIYVSARKEVPVGTLIKKIRPSFMTVLRTGGISAGFGQIEQVCVRSLGIEDHFTAVSLPYGLLLYMPANVIGTLAFTIYAASVYGVKTSPGWVFAAMLLAVILFVATPPVPGANLLAYIMIFAQLGVPSHALVDAMIFDIFFGIFASAANQAMLQMELVLQSDHMGLLDRDILRRGV